MYQIAREGIMNALKHAGGTDIWVKVNAADEDIVMGLRDNGDGFDTSMPGPEGHYGMATMRERAKVGGGSFEVVSAPGEGTVITVRFPISLLQRDQETDSGPASSNSPRHVLPLDSPGTTEQEAEVYRGAVPA